MSSTPTHDSHLLHVQMYLPDWVGSHVCRTVRWSEIEQILDAAITFPTKSPFIGSRGRRDDAGVVHDEDIRGSTRRGVRIEPPERAWVDDLRIAIMDVVRGEGSDPRSVVSTRLIYEDRHLPGWWVLALAVDDRVFGDRDSAGQAVRALARAFVVDGTLGVCAGPGPFGTWSPYIDRTGLWNGYFQPREDLPGEDWMLIIPKDHPRLLAAEQRLIWASRVDLGGHVEFSCDDLTQVVAPRPGVPWSWVGPMQLDSEGGLSRGSGRR